MSPRQRLIACYTFPWGLGIMLADLLVFDFGPVAGGIIAGIGGLLMGHGLGTLIMPRRPFGVTLRTDDTIIDLDKRLWYAGRDASGIQQWRCPLTAEEITLAQTGQAYIRVELIPTRSALDFGHESEDDDDQ